MRKILIITFAILCNFSFAQKSPCVNNVSTDYNAPTNSNLPIPYDGLFLNNFNWVPFTPQGSLGRLQTVGVQHLGSDQFMNPLYRPPLSPMEYYQYLRDELVMPTGGQGGFIPNHQNGWELIGVNLGFYPDGSTFTSVNGESNKYPTLPYVILYHRYLHKIRVFVNVHDECSLKNAYDAARIRLTLLEGNNFEINGLFRLQEGIDRSLDQEINVLSIGAVAAAPNDKHRWIIADFTVAYDPCVCIYASAFKVDVELIENIDFQLYGRGIETTEDIVDTDGSFYQNNQEYFSNFSVDFDDPKIVDGGFVMYENMQNMFNDYIARMEEL